MKSTAWLRALFMTILCSIIPQDAISRSSLSLAHGSRELGNGFSCLRPTGLLLRNVSLVTIIQKPYHSSYIHIMVIEIKFLNSNPAKGIHQLEEPQKVLHLKQNGILFAHFTGILGHAQLRVGVV